MFNNCWRSKVAVLLVVEGVPTAGCSEFIGKKKILTNDMYWKFYILGMKVFV